MHRRYYKVPANDQRSIENQKYDVLPPLTRNPSIAAPRNKKWVFDDDFSDEFSEHPQLDQTKWVIGNPTWNGRQPGYFKKENVFIHKSDALYLRSRQDNPSPLLKRQGYHSFSTAFVRSRKTRKYGYFEIVCRLMDSEISSAFWFSNPKGPQWTELDVFEYSTTTKKEVPQNMKYNRLFATNYHVHRHWDKSIPKKYKDPKSYDLGFDLSSKRIKVGFNWQPDTIEWYVNDVLVRKEENNYFHQDLHLQFDSETFPDWFGLPVLGRNNLPQHFRIMYVRSWYLKDTNR